MKIKKQGNKIIVEIDYWQSGKNTLDDGEWTVNNLYGVIAGEEMTISQANYLDYKDDNQEGCPLIHYYGDKEDFIKLCNKLDIIIIEHEVCAKCHKPIYGCSIDSKKIDEKYGGMICSSCNFEEGY